MQAHDSGAAIQAKGDKLTWKVFRSVLLDKNLYMIAVIYFANVAGNFGLTFTMPQIIKNMGFTSSNAQLLNIPPYCVGAVSAYTTSRIAGHFRWRMPFIVSGFTLVIVSFAILFSYSADNKHIGACYFALVLSCIGFFPISPAANSWTSSNLSGPMKRAAGIGFMLMIGNSGGVVGGFIYVGREKPSYPTGFGTTFGLAALGIMMALALEFLLWRSNKKNAKYSEAEVREMYGDEQLADMGDRSPLFRYML
jgi:predicted MFS family arabinose efflux permease